MSVKPHPRIRKTVKWGSAAATVLLLTAWIGSCVWWFVWISAGAGSLHLGQGRLNVWYFENIIGDFFPYESRPDLPPPRDSEYYFARAERVQMNLRFEWSEDVMFGQDRLNIPLWAPAMVGLCMFALAWRIDARASRRERMGKCQGCGYDRVGLASGVVCPECGTLSKP